MCLSTTNATPKVQWIEITEENSGQRLDNFLITFLKGVPKTRIYRIIRKGEVRVNKGRISNRYRLAVGDKVRVPPVRMAVRNTDVVLQPALKYSLECGILYEDDALLVLNKPAGFAVHGGSGIHSGVIEGLRVLRPDARFLDLAHRLDKYTSGCLLVAKKKSVLRLLHVLFRDNGIKKTYLALLVGVWNSKQQVVTQPLLRSTDSNGERVTKISQDGKFAQTQFRLIQNYKSLTLVEATPKTGRTHQIRVHAAWLGHPIVGDNRYGDIDDNKKLRDKGHKHLFLHAEQLHFTHPISGKIVCFKAPLAGKMRQKLEATD